MTKGTTLSVLERVIRARYSNETLTFHWAGDDKRWVMLLPTGRVYVLPGNWERRVADSGPAALFDVEINRLDRLMGSVDT